VGDETLYSIPFSALATVGSVSTPSATAPAYPLKVEHTGPSSWRLAVNLTNTALVRFRLTAVPGWHATVDGRPLPLHSWSDGAMLEADVPAGHNTIELRYWPDLFTVGLIVAAVAAVGMALACTIVAIVRRRRTLPEASSARTRR
jgi:Bacterial membrane protein YfhO